MYQNDKKVGVVTSGAFSPILNVGVGLAMIDTDGFDESQSIELRDKRSSLEANITTLPFITK